MASAFNILKKKSGNLVFLEVEEEALKEGRMVVKVGGQGMVVGQEEASFGICCGRRRSQEGGRWIGQGMEGECMGWSAPLLGSL